MKFICLFILAFSFSAKAQTINDNLLIHYPMDNNVQDYSGNGYDGTANGVIYGDDRFGTPNSACYFDGIDDYIDFPNLSELKPVLPVSFSFWIKYESSQSEDRAVFCTSLEEDVSSGVLFTQQSSTGAYAVGYGDGSNSYSSSTRRSYVSNSIIDQNNWHHIAIVISSELDMKVYVDCIEAGGTYSGTGGALQYSPTPGSLGRHDQNVGLPAYHFNGLIDDFRYWDRALVASDIDTLCNNILSIDSEPSNDFATNIWPTPAGDFVHFKTDATPSTIIITDLTGKLILRTKYKTKLDVSEIQSGAYFIILLDSSGTPIVNKRIIKQ